MATKIFVNLPVKDLNKDHGWMYGHSFANLDGHQWEILYMDEKAVPQNQ